MPIYPISQNYTDQLCYTGKDQVGMKCFFILRPTTGESKAVLEMVDGTFYRGSDLVSAVPLVRTPKGAGISAQILFGIKIDHPSAGRRGAGIFTVAGAAVFTGGIIFFPFDFRAGKLISGNTAP